MTFERNNIDFEIKENNGLYELWGDNRLLGIYETEKECVTASHMYERITVPFSVL